MDKNTITVIEGTADLIALCKKLHQEPWFAIDTEFLREKTFHSQLCLIQVATNSYAACIDPIKLPNITPFIEVLNNNKVIKVFHSAVQDIEIFYQMNGKVPAPLFDTQLAMPLLGEQDFMGYGPMVKKMLDVTLSKSHTRTNWMHRPLLDAQLQYAIDDVIYLAKVYPILLERLEKRGRLEWLQPEFDNLESGKIFQKPAIKIWDKHPTMRQLKSPIVSAIQHLLAWREETIRKIDIPRKWFLSDHDIVDIAKQNPKNKKELAYIRAIPKKTFENHATEILDIVTKARNLEPEPLPPSTRKAKLTKSQQSMADLLVTLVNLRSEELEINSSVLAPRAQINLLLTEPERSSLLEGWRKELIGDQLMELLEGKITLKVIDQKVVLKRI